jgi:8-oxo-dGTP pyrophosphatase MutT (NUDIX family)
VTRRIAAVALVDERGWILLQERDERAPVDPDHWSLVGGGVEAGESDAGAAVRELAEETGLRGVALDQVAAYSYYCAGCDEDHEVALFLALTDLADDDVVCGEGRRIVFVDPRTVDGLRWSHTLVHGLPRVIGHPAYVERFGRVPSRGFGCVILVDARGRLLLQERDERARIDPDRWGLCGGHLEPGEAPETGAYRELAEETGVHLRPGTLEHVDTLDVFHPAYGSVDQVHVYAGRVALTDADIDCREGRRIVFVDPGVARHLDLTMTGALAVPAFLGSETYRRLTADSGSLPGRV